MCSTLGVKMKSNKESVFSPFFWRHKKPGLESTAKLRRYVPYLRFPRVLSNHVQEPLQCQFPLVCCEKRRRDLYIAVGTDYGRTENGIERPAELIGEKNHKT